MRTTRKAAASAAANTPTVSDTVAKPRGRPKAAASAEKAVITQALPKMKIQKFVIWIVGNTPLITHAWSEKARRSMLTKQQKTATEGKVARDPQADFLSSLYIVDGPSPLPGGGKEVVKMDDKVFGFPAMAVKKALLSAAHKDRGVPRETVRAALWVDGKWTQTRPALAGAVCDMPLLPIYGGQPAMREDMVKIGKGLNKTADLAYRAQFWPWAIRVTGKLNTSMCPGSWLPLLVRHSGLATGIGDWRNEKGGMFGAYHYASPEEITEWEDYIHGRGDLPKVPDFDETDFDEEELLPEAAE